MTVHGENDVGNELEDVLGCELARVHGRRVDVWRVGPGHALARALPTEIALYEIDRALAVLRHHADGSAGQSDHDLTVALETAGAFVAILDQLEWDSLLTSPRPLEPAMGSVALEARFRALPLRALPSGASGASTPSCGATHVSMLRRGHAWVSWEDGRLALYDAALAVDHADRGDVGDLERFCVATASTFPWAALLR